MTRAVSFVVAAGTCAIAILLIAQVFFRYVLNASLAWSEEVSTFIMIWVGMLGVALLAARDDFIAFTLLKRSGHPALRRFSTVVSVVATLIFAAFLAYFGLFQSVFRRFSPTSSAAEIPLSWVYAVFPVAGALIIWFLLPHLWRARGRHD